MGFLKALESRVTETKAAYDSRGSDGQVLRPLCYNNGNNPRATVPTYIPRGPELTGWRENHFITTCTLLREQKKEFVFRRCRSAQ